MKTIEIFFSVTGGGEPWSRYFDSNGTVGNEPTKTPTFAVMPGRIKAVARCN